MKTVRFAALLLIVVSSFDCFSQKSKEEQKAAQEAEIKSMVESRNFVFKARSAMPTRGSTQQLSVGYDIAISPDEVVSDLPYFGRAYQAPMNSSDGGIKFTSTEFDYTVKERKKGGWDITIITKDVPHALKAYLSVSLYGNTTVRIISTNRDPISFSGLIETKKKD